MRSVGQWKFRCQVHLSPRDIPAVTQDEALRLELYCSLQVSVGLCFSVELAAVFITSCLFWGWQQLLFSVTHASGNIAPVAVISALVTYFFSGK